MVLVSIYVCVFSIRGDVEVTINGIPLSVPISTKNCIFEEKLLICVKIYVNTSSSLE